MWRILRAFAWMRWRVLLNSLERTGARDTVERLSLAVEQIGPIIAYLLLVPSAIGLAALGGYTGYRIAGGETAITFEVLRILLLVACGFAVVGPLLMPAMDPTVIVRLLLLPISRRTLYASQVASGLSEPWVLISLPVVLSIPVGLAYAGLWLAAAVSLAAGLLLILGLIGISTLTALLLHLLVRDRRRGELLTLVFIVVFPAIAMLPGLLSGTHRGPAASERKRNSAPMPAWVTDTAKAAYAVVPSQLFAHATRSAAEHRQRDAARPLGVLVASGAVLHALGMLTFGRLLDSPSAGMRRRPARSTGSGSVRLPFLSRASAAVAQAQLRLAMRTPRGRSIMLSPFAVFVVFAIVMRYQQGQMELGVMSLNSGLALATFGGAVCLLSLLPFAVNQFAIDRAGLTLVLLSPLETFELLTGKAVGLGLVAGGPALLVMLVALVLYPGGPAALWLSVPPALVATYLLAAPGAAALSAVFPRTVDLNSIGKGSNPHSLANLLGLLVFAAAGVPGILIVFVTASIGETPALTPIVMLAWCAVALLISRLMFRGVVRLFDRRRENLGIVAV